MDLKRQLHQLKDVSHPNPNWVARNRANLLSEINSQYSLSDRRESKGLRQAQAIFSLFQIFQFYPRLAAVAVAVFVVFFTSVGLTQAAKGAVPGSRLYAVKLALERTGVQMAPTQAVKTRIQLELASERLKEAQQVANAPEQAKEALNNFQSQLNEAVRNVDIKKMGSTTPQEAAELGHLLTQKTREYKASLKSTEASLSDSNKQKTQELKKAVDNSSMKAMELIVASVPMGGVSEEKAASVIKEKIVETEADAKEAEQKMVQLRLRRTKPAKGQMGGIGPLPDTQQAKDVLESAKNFLNAKDLPGAVAKVKESVELLNQAQEQAE